MNNRDEDLDELLEPLRRQTVKAKDLHSWKKALKNKQSRIKRRSYIGVLSVAAALVLGFFAGWQFSESQRHVNASSNFSMASATKVERFINTE